MSRARFRRARRRAFIPQGAKNAVCILITGSRIRGIAPPSKNRQ